MNAILSRIRELQPDLPPKAKQIAELIIGRPGSFIHMSITEVAETCGVSEGTIVSFCRRVGVRGFQELKILLARDLIEPVRLIQEDLHRGDDPATVTDHIFAAHAASLRETRRLLSMESLAKAASLLREAQRIEIYGIGSSAPIAQDLSYRLLQLGLAAGAVVDSHVQAVSAGMTGPKSRPSRCLTQAARSRQCSRPDWRGKPAPGQSVSRGSASRLSQPIATFCSIPSRMKPDIGPKP